ncbi:MAG: hypothetical protein HC835_19475 [Oscillatoriales cyanobacterium RM2_1_1]|nr:hypothetical protein [Oscillatoriales cyanobacterium RM2_1_1]
MDRSLCTQPPYNGGAYQRSPERNRSLFVEEYDPTNIDPIVQLQILPSQPGKKIRPYSIHVTGFSGTKALRIERYNQSVSLNTQVIQTLSINPNSRQLVTFNGQAHDADFLLFVCTGKGNNSFFVDLLAFELV